MLTNAPRVREKAPLRFLRSAPHDAPAVRVGFVSATVGYGLFAARDFAQDEFIFHEAPLMTALFNEKFSADKHLMQSQVAAYRAALAAHRDVTVLAFPSLAARFGIAPPPFDDAAAVLSAHLGRNLVHGRFAGSTITREQYEAYTARLAVAAARPSEAAAREACLDFFKHYAFEVRQGAGVCSGRSALVAATNEACIYLLASLINHCCTPSASSFRTSAAAAAAAATFSHCHSSSSHSPSSSSNSSPPSSCSSTTSSASNSTTSKKPRHHKLRLTFNSTASSDGDDGSPPPPPPGPNCSWRIGPSGLAHFVKPRHICVQARRPIRAGEQLTWDYGKRHKGFVCECETCRHDGFLAGLGSSCHVL